MKQEVYAIPKKELLGLSISIGTYSQFIGKICELARLKKSSYICLANVHMLINARDSNNYKSIINNADLVAPDGMPLVRSLKLFYGIEQRRVAGMDLLPDLLREAERRGISVYFYGGSPEIIRDTREYIRKEFSGLMIAGSYSPPFRPLNPAEERSVVNEINESGAQLVFVVLGCPKQENWMGLMKGKINACMIGVGGALPVMIGLHKRAPVWMQEHCLEWLYRLIREPRRLFWRYALTNTGFILLITGAWIKYKLEATLELLSH